MGIFLVSQLISQGIPIFIFVSRPREGSFSGFGEEKKKNLFRCFSNIIFFLNIPNKDLRFFLTHAFLCLAHSFLLEKILTQITQFILNGLNKWKVDEHYKVLHEYRLSYIHLVIGTNFIVYFNRALSNFYVFFLNISVVFFSGVCFFFLEGGQVFGRLEDGKQK